MIAMCWVRDFYDEKIKQVCVEYYCQKNNDRRIQFKSLNAPPCPKSFSLCATCAKPDCAEETKIIKMEMQFGKKIGLLECGNYEKRKEVQK